MLCMQHMTLVTLQKRIQIGSLFNLHRWVGEQREIKSSTSSKISSTSNIILDNLYFISFLDCHVIYGILEHAHCLLVFKKFSNSTDKNLHTNIKLFLYIKITFRQKTEIPSTVLEFLSIAHLPHC